MPSEEDFDEPDEPPEPDELLDDDADVDDMVLDYSSDEEEFVEYDPSGRYGRYVEILGKGAMKTVYRAYDMVDCKEVAWNKAKPPIECSDEQAIAVWREIHILQGLNHKGIIRLDDAWVDNTTGDTNFITELCSSTLLEYRLKHKHLSRKAVKSWGRQILKGLVHLHMQNPPIIHRDLKCENILVKCRSNTALKIGDFGSATYLDETHHMHTLVGTPEFMAPEMFQEDYNELVDVYSFGMCMLELLTRECPYSECKSLGQIYKKVINGEKPKALYKVTDVQALQLINRCLLPANKRPSASELLADPFLQCAGASTNSSMKVSNSMPNLRVPTTSFGVKNVLSGQGAFGKLARPCAAATKSKAGDLACVGLRSSESADHIGRKALFTKSPSFRRSYRVMGRVEDQNTLQLKIRIQESSRSCDIDFPFDLRYDSPRSVAEEMVRVLDYAESDLVTIADLIRDEIAALVQEGSSMHAAGNFDASRMDVVFTSGQFSYAGAREHDCIADQIVHPRKTDTSYERLASSKDAGLAAGETSEKTFSDSSRAKFSTYASLSTGKCCDVIVSPAENGEIRNKRFSESYSMSGGALKSRNSFSLKCHNEQGARAAYEITGKTSLYMAPCALSATNWGTCDTSHIKVESMTNALPLSGCDGRDVVGHDGRDVVANGVNGRENNTILDNSHVHPSPSHRSSVTSSRFKQLPAGIGILLLPSTEQGLRRSLPSCVNVFA
eukprot:c25111_g2_i1 orf=695-2872(-)